MFWVITFVSLFVLIGCYKADLCSGWAVLVGFILLPILPVVFWLIFMYYLFKLIFICLFKKWA